jgi:hypothetical protein
MRSGLINNLQDSCFDNFTDLIGSDGNAINAVLSLDAPMDSSISTLSAGAFGFDRLVEGFTGNTVRLVRTSDSAESDFGFSSTTGMFDFSAVDSWRSTSDVNVVRFYNQSGGAITLDASGTVTFVVSNVVKRFGTTYSDQVFSATKTNASPIVTVASTTLMDIGMVVTGTGIPTDTVIETVDNATQITLSRNVTVTETSSIIVKNGQLSRSNEGAVGCNLDTTAHFVTSSNLTIDTTAGLGISMLYSHNKRKVANNGSLIYGGDTVRESLFSYGLGTNNFIRNRVSGGNGVNFPVLRTSATHASQTGISTIPLPIFSQQGISFDITPNDFGYYSKSAKEANVTNSAQAITDIPNGTLNNGLLVIGSEFSNASGAVGTSNRADILFNSVIVHRPLTAANRYKVLNKLHAIGQQHNIMSLTDLKALFSDIILHKNINSGTGIVAGENSASTFNFNLPTIGSPTGTPTFTNNYTIPSLGISGLRSTNDTDNHYYSSDAVTPDLNGTIISLNMSESTSSNLCTDLSIRSGSNTSTETNLPTINLSFALARDHQQHSAMLRANDINVVGTRYYADRTTQFGASVYDGANQMMGKYNRNIGADTFVYGETVDGIVRTPASWANHGANSLGLDAPVISVTAENIRSIVKDDKLTLQVARFEAPVEYVKTDSIAVRTPFSLKSKNALFLSQSSIIGHQDGSISKTNYGGVVDNATGSNFKSFHGILQSYSGVRVLWAWTPTVLTDAQISKIDINIYKLVA